MALDRSRSTFILPPAPYMAARGYKGMYASTDSFVKRLEESFPDLSLYVDEPGQSYLIVREQGPTRGHPEGRLLIQKVVPFWDTSGARNILGEHIIHELQMGNPHSGREQMTYEQFNDKVKKNEAKQEANHQERMDELDKDAARMLALTGAIHRPRVSMYLSDREKRKKGIKENS